MVLDQLSQAGGEVTSTHRVLESAESCSYLSKKDCWLEV